MASKEAGATRHQGTILQPEKRHGRSPSRTKVSITHTAL
jgi:hypothetical protein